ncbi:hypothetical protein C0991_011848 [Blastosporella zonata]|nr:hypothetical protein C0991_011848 [Blastosporella zonata]
MDSSMEVAPNIFKMGHPSLTLDICHENYITPEVIGSFLHAIFNDVLGLAPTYGPKRVLKTLAIFNGTRAIIIHFSTFKAGKGKPTKRPSGRTHPLVTRSQTCL